MAGLTYFYFAERRQKMTDIKTDGMTAEVKSEQTEEYSAVATPQTGSAGAEKADAAGAAGGTGLDEIHEKLGIAKANIARANATANQRRAEEKRAEREAEREAAERAAKAAKEKAETERAVARVAEERRAQLTYTENYRKRLEEERARARAAAKERALRRQAAADEKAREAERAAEAERLRAEAEELAARERENERLLSDIKEQVAEGAEDAAGGAAEYSAGSSVPEAPANADTADKADGDDGGRIVIGEEPEDGRIVIGDGKADGRIVVGEDAVYMSGSNDTAYQVPLMGFVPAFVPGGRPLPGNAQAGYASAAPGTPAQRSAEPTGTAARPAVSDTAKSATKPAATETAAIRADTVKSTAEKPAEPTVREIPVPYPAAPRASLVMEPEGRGAEDVAKSKNQAEERCATEPAAYDLPSGRADYSDFETVGFAEAANEAITAAPAYENRREDGPERDIASGGDEVTEKAISGTVTARFIDYGEESGAEASDPLGANAVASAPVYSKRELREYIRNNEYDEKRLIRERDALTARITDGTREDRIKTQVERLTLQRDIIEGRISVLRTICRAGDAGKKELKSGKSRLTDALLQYNSFADEYTGFTGKPLTHADAGIPDAICEGRAFSMLPLLIYHPARERGNQTAATVAVGKSITGNQYTPAAVPGANTVPGFEGTDIEHDKDEEISREAERVEYSDARSIYDLDALKKLIEKTDKSYLKTEKEAKRTEKKLAKAVGNPAILLAVSVVGLRKEQVDARAEVVCACAQVGKKAITKQEKKKLGAAIVGYNAAASNYSSLTSHEIEQLPLWLPEELAGGADYTKIPALVLPKDTDIPVGTRMSEADKREQRREQLRLVAEEKKQQKLQDANRAGAKLTPEDKKELAARDKLAREQSERDCEMLRRRYRSSAENAEYDTQINHYHYSKGDGAPVANGKKALRKAEKAALKCEGEDNARYYAIVRSHSATTPAKRRVDRAELERIRQKMETLLAERDRINRQLSDIYVLREDKNAQSKTVSKRQSARLRAAKRSCRDMRDDAALVRRTHITIDKKQAIFELMDDITDCRADIAEIDYTLKKTHPSRGVARELKMQRKMKLGIIKRNRETLAQRIKAVRKSARREVSPKSQLLWLLLLLVLVGLVTVCVVFRAEIWGFITGLIPGGSV